MKGKTDVEQGVPLRLSCSHFEADNCSIYNLVMQFLIFTEI